MADDTSTNVILTGALFVGGGVAGYLGSRWLFPTKAEAATAPPIQTSPATRVASPSTAPPSPPAASARLSTPDQFDRAEPVSSPTQDASSSSAVPAGGLPRTYDPLFETYRGTIPIELLRALAMRESGMKPTVKGRAGWGLLQITEGVRADFNAAHQTNHARERLLEPAINIEIGCWLLRLIADRYERSHGDVRNMRTDWSNPRFAELLVFGYNAGWSSGGGVMRVVARLKELGARDIDLALVHENARQLGGGQHLAEPARVAWTRSVVALYQRERELAGRNGADHPFGFSFFS